MSATSKPERRKPRRWLGPLTIRSKIFAAFAGITLIMGVLGLYAASGMKEAGRMVVRTFDMPLMAINHARLAKSDFAELRYLMLRRHAGRVAEGGAATPEAIAEKLGELKEDLDIAARRSLSAEGKAAAARLRQMIAAWHAAYTVDAASPPMDWDALDSLAQGIEREFGVLVNISAGDAFHWRQSAIATVHTNRLLQIAGVAAALLLTVGITYLLARQILRPIMVASRAADRIAGGELETPIPKAGDDETGALLGAMTVMQDNLRAMMAREVAERRSAQRRLTDALENAEAGVVLVGADGDVLLANTEAARLFPAAADLLAPGKPFAAFVARARDADLAPRGDQSDLFKAAD
ncbi:MAG: HAMP domain-containing protein, partial [Alphaproteobacteria bacterium]